MKALIIVILLLLTGCINMPWSKPSPVLQDSDIPHQMKAGEYEDTKGNTFVVLKDKPRWSVSEGYLFEAVTEEEPKKFLGLEKEQWGYAGSCIGLLILGVRNIINGRRRKSAELQVKALKERQGD